MLPILLSSVVAMGIILERFWMLRTTRIAPSNLVAEVWEWTKETDLDATRIHQLRAGSPLGRILAAGLVNQHYDRVFIKERIEEVGRHVVHDLERFLNSLGTVAAITPLLGLLGTVIGMIKVFAAITNEGVGNPTVLAGGISEALITTAVGLSVAIPTLMFYRYFRGKVERLVVTMEQEVLKLLEAIHREKELETGADTQAAPEVQ